MSAGVGRAVSAAVVALVLAGCSDGVNERLAPLDHADGGTAESVTGEQQLAHAAEIQTGLLPIAEAYCAQKFRCCTDAELALDLGPGIDEKLCTWLVFKWALYGAGRGGSNSAPIPAVLQYYAIAGFGYDPKRITVDPAGAAACAKVVGDATCAADTGDPCLKPQGKADPCALRNVFRGHQANGDVCGSGWDSSSVDCAPGLTCIVLAPAHGVCVPEATSCTVDGECGVGYPCDKTTGTCSPGLGVGAACTFRNPANPVRGTEVVKCQPGLECDLATSKCVAPECAVGCSDGTDCGGRVCDGWRCAPYVAPTPASSPPPGAACTQYSCPTDQYCDGPDGGTGVCAKRLGRGELCRAEGECTGNCTDIGGELRCTGGDVCVGR